MTTVEQTLDSAEVLKEQQQKMHKLLRSPYFGRFDFTGDEDSTARAIYVGVHHFRDEHARETLVHDWRAPISSMFYGFEPGPACFLSPGGEVAGQVILKRQFRIRDGAMEFVLESGVSATHYQSDMDRNLLYVACTRAMHRLTLIAVGEPSPLLPGNHP